MEPVKFSFAEGGALQGILRKLGIARRMPSLRFRMGTAVLLTWFPLLALSASQGMAFSGKVRIPFLFDLIQHFRFLLALPLAIGAEVTISPRLEAALNRFLNGEMLSPKDTPRFQNAVSHARRLKDSLEAELFIAALSYLYVFFRLEKGFSPDLSVWSQFGMARAWYLAVSLPLFIFIWIRWVWRLLVWTFILIQTARLDLKLVATHPDHVGGLAFVAIAQRRFAILVFAISTISCASVAERILFGGASLREFESELATFLIICLLAVVGPLMVFSPLLIRIKLRDWNRYGMLATTYSREFDEKWIQKKTLEPHELLGNSDVQALSDLKNSYEGISEMRVFLPDRPTILIFVIAYGLPILPLLLTVVPMKQILSGLLNLLTR